MPLRFGAVIGLQREKVSPDDYGVCAGMTNIRRERAQRPRLERFQAKACPGLDPGWTPVRVKKTRQIKNLEPRFDSIETEKALVRHAAELGADRDDQHDAAGIGEIFRVMAEQL
jgi:hypothetical protein